MPSTLTQVQAELARAEAAVDVCEKTEASALAEWQERRCESNPSRDRIRSQEIAYLACAMPLAKAIRTRDAAAARFAAASTAKSELAALDRADAQAAADAAQVLQVLEEFCDKPLRVAIARAAASAEASSEAFERIPHATRAALGQASTPNRWASLAASSPSVLGAYVAQLLASRDFSASLTGSNASVSTAVLPKDFAPKLFRTLIPAGQKNAARSESP